MQYVKLIFILEHLQNKQFIEQSVRFETIFFVRGLLASNPPPDLTKSVVVCFHGNCVRRLKISNSTISCRNLHLVYWYKLRFFKLDYLGDVLKIL
jgi:hypothetical protein